MKALQEWLIDLGLLALTVAGGFALFLLVIVVLFLVVGPPGVGQEGYGR